MVSFLVHLNIVFELLHLLGEKMHSISIFVTYLTHALQIELKSCTTIKQMNN